MTPQEAKILLKKYLNGTCTDDECALVESWHNEELRKSAAIPPEDKLTHVYTTMRQTVLTHAAKQGYVKKLYRWLPYVAATVLFTIATTWVFRTDFTLTHSPSPIVPIEDIAPGSNRATLQLANGRTVELSENKQGIIVSESLMYNDGTLLPLTELDNDRSVPELLKLSTPRGGQYQVTLPDGSKIWLNAASTLKYPARFDQDERVVELEGEAYFEISKLRSAANEQYRIPFKVITKSQTVEVVGTQFNISAYMDEAETKTTLVEGSVRVVPASDHGTAVTLQPGQQTILRDGRATVQHVDVTQFTAWKDGFFYFDGMAPQAAFAQLERWYDIEVVYQGKMPTTRFFGMLDRTDNLSTALTILKESGLKFKLERRGARNQLIVVGE